MSAGDQTAQAREGAVHDEEAAWRHPGEGADATAQHRLCWTLRVFCLRRFANEVVRPHHRTMVTGESFDPDRAFRERPERVA